MAVVGVTALSMAACNRGTESAGGGSDSVTIGLAVANLQADFFNQIKQSVDAEAKKAGATVRVSDAGGDAATQVNQIQDFITRQVDVIIYIPAGGKGELAILQGQIGTTPQVDRQKGFTQALSANPGIKVVAQQPADWAQDKAFSVAQDMLQANPDIDIFWGQADAMALGAAQAVKNANVKQKVIIAGFDGDIAGLKAVRAGQIDATMVQQTQAMGRLAVKSALDLTAKKKLPATQLQEAFLLTKADTKKADEYIAQHP